MSTFDADDMVDLSDGLATISCQQRAAVEIDRLRAQLAAMQAQKPYLWARDLGPSDGIEVFDDAEMAARYGAIPLYTNQIDSAREAK